MDSRLRGNDNKRKMVRKKTLRQAQGPDFGSFTERFQHNTLIYKKKWRVHNPPYMLNSHKLFTFKT
jgi:hypothetical protein